MAHERQRMLPMRMTCTVVVRARSSQAGVAHEAGYASVPRTSARTCGYCGGSSAPAGGGPAVAQLLEHPGRAASIVDEAVTVTEDEFGARTVDHRLAIDVEPDNDSH